MWLVAQRHTQIKKKFYDDIYTPVVRLVTKILIYYAYY